MWSCPLLSIRRSSFRPGWSGVLAKEVGGELKPEAPGVGAEGIEEGEEVLGAEDSVSQRKRQGGWNDASAVLHHPRVWPPLHSRCLSRSVYNCLSWVEDLTFRGALSPLVESAGDDGVRNLSPVSPRMATGAQGGAEEQHVLRQRGVQKTHGAHPAARGVSPQL